MMSAKNLTVLAGLAALSFAGAANALTTGGSSPTNPDNVTLTSQATISLYAPPVVSPANLIVFTTPTNMFGPIPVAGGANFGPQTVVAPGSSTNPSYAGSFLPFEAAGGGFLSLPVTANGQSQANDTNGNINTSIRTTASAFGSVVYTYTPSGVPEPGSVAMLIAGGITGAGFFIRRRK